jgi:FkbM family methyltransferase
MATQKAPRVAPLKYIYTVILKPVPLRSVANFVLKKCIPESITFPEGTLLLNKNDAVVSGALALGAYERAEIALFREVVKEGMTVLDIGANIGYYTLVASALVGEAGRVVSFEPEQTNFFLLQKTVELNNRANVSLVCAAASDTEGTSTLYLSDENKGKHSMASGDDLRGAQTIQTTTVSIALRSLGIAHVDVIKMDIEGAEPLALAGMRDIIERDKPLVLVEYSPGAIHRFNKEPREMLRFFAERGYELSVIDERTGRLEQIKNIETFASQFPESRYVNLLCAPAGGTPVAYSRESSR